MTTAVIDSPELLPDDAAAGSGALCVDLDGSLVATDTLWESLLLLAKARPAALLRLPGWLSRGKAHVKQQIAAIVVPDPAALPYRPEVLSFVKSQRESGRRILLTTAANERIAKLVAGHLNLFDGVLASNGATNMSGETKLAAIRQACGDETFDYVGDSAADLPLWASAERAYVVGANARVTVQARQVCEPAEMPIAVDAPPPVARRTPIQALIKAMRPHQWSKNVLLAVPLLAAHKVRDLHAVGALAVAIMAFCAAASAVYVMNDLLDVESDRLHPTKRRRPFAAGDLSLRAGVLMTPLLLLTAFTLAALVSLNTALMLGAYVLLSSAYSMYLKRKVVIDVFTLVALYIWRILTGGVAVHIWPSPWLLAFSMFLFVSLAFAKRYAELKMNRASSAAGSKGRGYLVSDLEMLRSMGPSSGYLAVLVLCLYINSDAVLKLYHRPELLWFVCPIMLFALTRMWFLADRSQMLEDPVHFATHDRVSLLAGALIGLTVIAAAIL